MDLRKTPLALFLLTVLAGLLYANSLHVDFQFDDNTSIVTNRAVHTLDPAAWWAFWPGRILTYATFAMNWALGGAKVEGYHLLNLLIHLMAAVGLYFLVLQLGAGKARSGDRRWLALVAASIFLAHPLATQAVTYIVQRATSMAYGLYLWTVVFHLARLRRLEQGQDDRILLVASIVCAAAAALSKEVVVSLPVALLLAAAVATPDHRPQWKRAVPVALTVWGVALFAVVAGGSRFGVAGGALTAETTRVTRGTYFLTEIHAVARYLRLAILPLGQTVDFDLPWRGWPPGPSTWLLALMHLALWSFAVLAWKRGRRLWAFCVAWFYLLLAPTSSLFPIRDPFFEHRAYGALAAVAVAAALLLDRLHRRWPQVATVLWIAIVVGLGMGTVQRNRVWATPVSLWEDAVRKAPAKSRPHMAYGVALGQQGRLQEATVELTRAVQITPDFARAWNNLGQVLLRQGKVDEGLQALQRAVQLDPERVSAWYNLAVAQDHRGELDAAERAYRKALELDGHYAPALNGLAGLRLRRGDLRGAEQLARRAAAEGMPQPALLDAIRRAARGEPRAP